MNIGQAASQSGLPVKTLRYYEEIGLVKPGRIQGNDYRDYSAVDVEHLRFLQRARAVGFSLDVCRELLDLYRDENRRCSQVKKLVLEKIDQIEAQLQELQALKSVLTDMANGCAGDESAECSIIETLAQPKPSLMPFMLVES
ncbi:MerR family DNA-binding protein [Cellvibrio sp.]|uniref:MerR family DNA-binding protein n=1 Tax=Cellvibrio sp. TaxID=1965322 RepID=UPI00396482B8